MELLGSVPLAPFYVITATALLVLLAEAFVKKSEGLSFWISVLGLAAGIGLAAASVGRTGVAFNGMVTTGGYGAFFSAVFMMAALLTVAMSRDYLTRLHTDYGEFYLLLLLATLGMMLMAAAGDLIVVFLGIELMSVCLYVLAGFARQRLTSNEASLKYFLLGAFATGFLLYGIALLYGAAGTTNIPVIAAGFDSLAGSALFWAGAGLLLVGFAFKVGAVPFHMWIPDVYQGAPTTVSALMSTGAKAAAFSAFVLVFATHVSSGGRLQLVLSLLAAASMILGNIVAIAQTNIKRMLAYSSIAHAGYMLIGLAAGNQLGRSGIVYYLTAYTFMNVGAFGILSFFEEEGEKNLTFADYAGLGTRRPLLAALMSVFMLSLAGLPPLAGFFGKYYIFVAAVDAKLTWLAILGVLTSVVSVFYYLRVIMMMYFQPAGAETLRGPASMPGLAALCVAALAVLQLGLFPASLLSVINSLF